jgi:hypothetical protein
VVEDFGRLSARSMVCGVGDGAHAVLDGDFWQSTGVEMDSVEPDGSGVNDLWGRDGSADELRVPDGDQLDSCDGGRRGVVDGGF